VDPWAKARMPEVFLRRLWRNRKRSALEGGGLMML